jgi:hypothetical protein
MYWDLEIFHFKRVSVVDKKHFVTQDVLSIWKENARIYYIYIVLLFFFKAMMESVRNML